MTVKGVKTSANTAYAIIFRHESSGNFYSFEITPDGQWGFYKFVNGKATAISDYQSDAAIQTGAGATNEMRVLAVGSHFVFYVNGQQVGVADDSTFTSGGVGLANDDSDVSHGYRVHGSDGGAARIITGIVIRTLDLLPATSRSRAR